jgi:PHD/YefM family antitoxin component YafN of YafNO toxin-antitoxin module
MAKYRTAQGKVVDMSQLAAKNEKTRAVGNMNVNARGDTIDGQGRIILPVTKKVGEKYQRTVSNRAANIVKRKQVDSFTPIETAPAPEANIELTEEELEFLDTQEEDNEIEAIKAAKALEASRAETIKKKIQVKPASEAPDTFDPSKD